MSKALSCILNKQHLWAVMPVEFDLFSQTLFCLQRFCNSCKLNKTLYIAFFLLKMMDVDRVAQIWFHGLFAKSPRFFFSDEWRTVGAYLKGNLDAGAIRTFWQYCRTDDDDASFIINPEELLYGFFLKYALPIDQSDGPTRQPCNYHWTCVNPSAAVVAQCRNHVP